MSSSNHDPLAKRGERILQRMRRRGPPIVIQDTKEDPWGRPWICDEIDAKDRMFGFDDLTPEEREHYRQISDCVPLRRR